MPAPTNDELQKWIGILTAGGQPDNIVSHQFLRTAQALLAERKLRAKQGEIEVRCPALTDGSTQTKAPYLG